MTQAAHEGDTSAIGCSKGPSAAPGSHRSIARHDFSDSTFPTRRGFRCPMGGMFKLPDLIQTPVETALNAGERRYEFLAPRLPPVAGAALYAARISGHPLSAGVVAALESTSVEDPAWSICLVSDSPSGDGACCRYVGSYTAADFAGVRKFDSHAHANVDDHQFLDIGEGRVELLSIRWTTPISHVDRQATVVHKLARRTRSISIF